MPTVAPSGVARMRLRARAQVEHGAFARIDRRLLERLHPHHIGTEIREQPTGHPG